MSRQCSGTSVLCVLSPRTRSRNLVQSFDCAEFDSRVVREYERTSARIAALLGRRVSNLFLVFINRFGRHLLFALN